MSLTTGREASADLIGRQEVRRQLYDTFEGCGGSSIDVERIFIKIAATQILLALCGAGKTCCVQDLILAGYTQHLLLSAMVFPRYDDQNSS